MTHRSRSEADKCSDIRLAVADFADDLMSVRKEMGKLAVLWIPEA